MTPGGRVPIRIPSGWTRYSHNCILGEHQMDSSLVNRLCKRSYTDLDFPAHLAAVHTSPLKRVEVSPAVCESYQTQHPELTLSTVTADSDLSASSRFEMASICLQEETCRQFTAASGICKQQNNLVSTVLDELISSTDSPELTKMSVKMCSDTAFLCRCCGHAFENDELLRKHLSEHRGDVHLPASSIDNSLMCHCCNRAHDDVKQLVKHLLEHPAVKQLSTLLIENHSEFSVPDAIPVSLPAVVPSASEDHRAVGDHHPRSTPTLLPTVQLGLQLQHCQHVTAADPHNVTPTEPDPDVAVLFDWRQIPPVLPDHRYENVMLQKDVHHEYLRQEESDDLLLRNNCSPRNSREPRRAIAPIVIVPDELEKAELRPTSQSLKNRKRTRTTVGDASSTAKHNRSPRDRKAKRRVAEGQSLSTPAEVGHDKHEAVTRDSKSILRPSANNASHTPTSLGSQVVVDIGRASPNDTQRRETTQVAVGNQSLNTDREEALADGSSSQIIHTRARRHARINPFECVHCNREFDSSSGLLAHLSRLHRNMKSFRCSFCRAFVSFDELQSHRRGACVSNTDGQNVQEV